MKRGEASKNNDWASRPSAMFAAGVLGIASLLTMGVSLSRQLDADPAPARVTIDASSADAAPAPRERSAVRLINVNQAPLSELDLLPGIGPALGQRIIDHRDEHGPFTRIEDLQKVSGIGPRTLEKMRPLVSLGEAGGYTTNN